MHTQMATPTQKPSQPEASWSYIPHSPTKGAWETRFFKGQCKLREIPQLIKDNVYQCEGQLVFRTDDIPKPMKENVMEVEGRYYVPYNHIRELEEYMEHIKWNEKKNLHQVVIYRTGYFIQ
jgi:hypothetical protein